MSEPSPPAGFRLGARLGEGASAEVYSAYDERLQRPVALKNVPFDRFEASTARALLISEARMLARVRNPHVARVYDVEITDRGAWLVMELISGTNLRNVRRSSPVPLGRRLLWTIQLGNAIEALAAAGVVHRDIKPANIIVTREFNISLVDLGIAAPSVQHGAVGVCGTPAYMAPEQFAGVSVGPRTDVYAFGVVSFEILSGHHPFASALTTDIRAAHRNAPPPRLRQQVSGMPKWLDGLIRDCMAKRPAERPSIRDVNRTLAQHLIIEKSRPGAAS